MDLDVRECDSLSDMSSLGRSLKALKLVRDVALQTSHSFTASELTDLVEGMSSMCCAEALHLALVGRHRKITDVSQLLSVVTDRSDVQKLCVAFLDDQGRVQSSGFSASDLLAAGFSASALLAGGFSASDLRAGGFSASGLRAGGFPASDLRDNAQGAFSFEEMCSAGAMVEGASWSWR